MQHAADKTMSRCVYLVPEDIVNSWRTNQRMQQMDFPKKTVVADIDTKMSKELQRTDLTDREKMFSHGQQLGELFSHRNNHSIVQSQPPPPPPAVTQTVPSSNKQREIDKEVMEHVPTRLQARAKRLRDVLKMSPDLSWDKENVLWIKGKKIEGSNFSDLLHDAVRTLPAPESPAGTSALKSYLNSEGLSKTYLYNKRWKTNNKPIEDDSAVVSINTPLPAKRSGTDLSAVLNRDSPAYKKAAATPLALLNWETVDEDDKISQRQAKLSAVPKIKSWLGVSE